MRPYSDHYRYTATLLSAIARRNHHYLTTRDNNQRVLLKVYRDKTLAEEVAVFQQCPDRVWILLRQETQP